MANLELVRRLLLLVNLKTIHHVDEGFCSLHAFPKLFPFHVISVPLCDLRRRQLVGDMLVCFYEIGPHSFAVLDNSHLGAGVPISWQ